ncbi:hypothetical protein ZHAS_00006094 [Anopheles sinensis]|uniref:Uncharacterized protein n=1 Tax=Anopheles sinensis TaxID=74873 RepID=A0A084VL50_ANOSI|nr:hypothetical protein ZHAS_00006094 [Anopheles sinensis]
MCSYAEQNVSNRDGMCWCFEEISLMILVQRILMYLWYRLLLKMFPRLSVMPGCHDCTGPRRSLPCGQLADQYWKASYFSRTLKQTTGRRCCDVKTLQQPFSSIGFCNHQSIEPACVIEELAELDDQEQFMMNSSDISQLYQSTFLEEDYDECFLAEDIAWDAPVPELKRKPFQEYGEPSLLLNDYYIDDDLDDHLYAAEFQSAIGNSLFCDSLLD